MYQASSGRQGPRSNVLLMIELSCCMSVCFLFIRQLVIYGQQRSVDIVIVDPHGVQPSNSTFASEAC
jgi:hypothetical protein